MPALVWPVRFAKHVPRDKPVSVKLNNTDYVLWRNEAGSFSCAVNRCPHRHARLSCGSLNDGQLQCSYHAWQFGSDGTCLGIPQLPPRAKYPRACNLQSVPTTLSDGIVWITTGHGERVGTPTNLLAALGSWDLCTEKTMRLNNSYRLQVENAMDASHLHTVHDGFQGRKHLISPIACTQFYEDKEIITAHFRHESDTPDMEIVFLKPGTVIVKVLDRHTQALMRTNVINVCPETDVTCHVLFRDIAYYSGTVVDPMVYSFLVGFVVDAIFAQDIEVVSQQQVSTEPSVPYCMPAPADRAIAAFRRWCKHMCI